MKLLLVCVFWFAFQYPASGGMPWPFEDHLRRAESIMLARVVACDGRTITLRCTERLRGKADAEVVLSWGGIEPGATYFVPVGSEFLLLSQSTKEVPMQPIFDVPFHMGVGMARGLGHWLPLSLQKIGKEAYVRLDGGFDGAYPWWDEPSGGTSISHVKRSLERFAYDPNAEIH